MAVLKERLHLTQEQESQVFPIVEDAAKERRAIIQKCREDPMSNAATLRNELIKLRERTEKKLTPILSHEQMNEYWRFLTEMPQQSGSREGRPADRDGPTSSERLVSCEQRTLLANRETIQ